MAHEVKYNKAAGGSPAERIAARLRNSGAGAKPDQTVVHGTGDKRVFTNLHHSASQKAHGPLSRGGEGGDL